LLSNPYPWGEFHFKIRSTKSKYTKQEEIILLNYFKQQDPVRLKIFSVEKTLCKKTGQANLVVKASSKELQE
jgi:hypothetical protein